MSILGAAAGLLPHLGDLAPGALDRWVAAALAQAAALHEHDAWLYPTDLQRMPAAERLHDAWRQWVAEAEGLLAQIGRAGSAGRPVAGVNALRDEVGYAGCMIQISPTEMERRRGQVARGDVLTIGEVRRELRLGPRA